MPGADVTGYTEPGQDLYPQSEDEHRELLTWTQQAFQAADSARRPYYDKWARYYKLYRSYLKRQKGDWQSRVFIPYCFSVIETITPKLVAQLPKFLVMPVGPEDVFAAEQLERMLDNAARSSEPDLYLQLVHMIKSSLKYGTGMLKTYYDQVPGQTRQNVPITQPVMGQPQPVIDPQTGMVATDLAGMPMFDQPQQVGEQVVGMQTQRVPVIEYEGPCVSWVDIFNFWPAPEADDIDPARYVIERFYRPMSHIIEKVASGDYHFPPEMSPEDITDLTDDPGNIRKSSIDLGAGSNNDPTRKDVELLEYWTDDHRIITVANRKAIIRVQENPFDHRQKPYIRVVDYVQEGEFWGVGEVEAIEGLQDVENAIINQRIDNIRLTMNKTYAFNEQALTDPRDLQTSPGSGIRVSNDRNPRDVLMPIDMGDVTPNAFAEAEQMERLIERVSGASAYQAGLDSPSMNDTATGTSIVMEAGNTKFALKSRLSEIMGLQRLARQWGSLIQQFTSQERYVRILGQDGAFTFQQLQPDSILGSVDYSIETASSQSTESIRKQQAMQLLQLVAGIAPQAVPQLLIDLLESFGKKNLAAYIGPQAQQYALQMAQLQNMLSQGAPGQGMQPGQPGQQQQGQNVPEQVPGPGGQPPPQQGGGQVLPFPPQAPQVQVRQNYR